MSQMTVISPAPVGISTQVSRSSPAWAFDPSGNLVEYAVDVARYNWAPGTGTFEGLLWEPFRTNLFRNANPSPQSVSLSEAGTYTFSFYGTSTVTISGSLTVNGAATASVQLVGTGAGRSVITFGSSGPDVTFEWTAGAQYMQLEQGGFATSYIATGASQVSRMPEVFSYVPSPTDSESALLSSGLVNTTFEDATPRYDIATTYALGELVRYGNRIYESLQAGNKEHDPLAEPDQFVDDPETPTWWLDLKPSNDFAMFDRVQADVSVGANGVQNFAFKTPSAVNGVAFLNTQADVIHVAVSNGAGGLATQTVQVRGGVAVFTRLDVPGGTEGGAVVSVFATRNAGPVVIGEFVCGTRHTIGQVQYGLRYGITDYSTKKTNAFGNTRFVRRAFSKRITASLVIDSTTTTGGEYDLTNITALLEYLRASPTVWIASESPRFAGVGVVYGSYKDFTVAVDYASHALCELEIEGLI